MPFVPPSRTRYLTYREAPRRYEFCVWWYPRSRWGEQGLFQMNSRPIPRCGAAWLAFAAVLLGTAAVAPAADLYWSGTGAGNTFVLSIGYNEFASGNLNIWYRENFADAFVPLGTSFAGHVPWTSAFTTPGQYGVDTSAGTVWVVTDHNNQFVIVPEPGMLGLAAAGLAGGICYHLRRRRAAPGS